MQWKIILANCWIKTPNEVDSKIIVLKKRSSNTSNENLKAPYILMPRGHDSSSNRLNKVIIHCAWFISTSMLYIHCCSLQIHFIDASDKCKSNESHPNKYDFETPSSTQQCYFNQWNRTHLHKRIEMHKYPILSHCILIEMLNKWYELLYSKAARSILIISKLRHRIHFVSFGSCVDGWTKRRLSE